MLRLVEQVSASGYAVGLFAYTSMFTLCMSHTHTIRRCHEELRITFDPIGREFHFEYCVPSFREAWAVEKNLRPVGGLRNS